MIMRPDEDSTVGDRRCRGGGFLQFVFLQHLQLGSVFQYHDRTIFSLHVDLAIAVHGGGEMPTGIADPSPTIDRLACFRLEATRDAAAFDQQHATIQDQRGNNVIDRLG